MGVQGPFQSHILGGAQQISFVGISKAANPPCPCSASYSLTHFTAWVNSDSRARLPPLPWSHQPPKPSLCPLPKPTLLTTAPSSGEVGFGKGAPMVQESLGMFRACPPVLCPQLPQEQGVCCPWRQCWGHRGGQGVHTWQGKKIGEGSLPVERVWELGPGDTGLLQQRNSGNT